MIVEIVAEALASFLSWRAWVCVIAAFALGYVLDSHEIWIIWPSDVFVVTVILGIILGICWDRHVE